ncbi:MAG: hypothetical protein RL264_2903 [Bacteroidota bacterium]|jgi:two-component system LytT family response regulator
MQKVILIDDEPLARVLVAEYLAEFPEFEIVASCADGFEGAKAIAQFRPDLIFLDVQMPKINGFEMLEIINEQPAVIFTTAYDEFALKAFENNALDYLLKPFSEERFRQAIQKYQSKSLKNVTADVSEMVNKFPEEQSRIVIKDGGEITIIPVADVEFFEAYDDYVKVNYNGKNFLKKKTMNFYEKVLPKNQFIRVHRSFILNINHLAKIESFEKNSYIAILKSGKRLPISRNSYSDLKHALGL